MAEILQAPLALFIPLLVVVLLGAAVQHMLGIGLGLIASPLLLLLDPRLVPAVTLMLGAFSALPNAVSSLRLVNWHHIGVSMIGRVIGSVLAAWLLAVVIGDTASRTFGIVFAVTLLAAALLTSVGGLAGRLRPTKTTVSIASFVSSLMGTMTSIGGPPIALVYRLENPRVARAHLNVMVCTGAAVSLTALAAAGFVGRHQLVSALVLCGPALLGIWLGRRYTGIAGRHFKHVILVIIVIAALMILFRSL